MGDLPALRKLVERLRGKPFALLGVLTDGGREAVKPLLEREPVPWRNAIDGGLDGPIGKLYNARAWPSVWVLDAKGVIRHRDVRGGALGRAVDRLLSEVDK